MTLLNKYEYTIGQKDEGRMNLYHIEPLAYGTRGSVVIAENDERARDLYLEKYPLNSKYKLSIDLLSGDLSQEFVSEEFLE